MAWGVGRPTRHRGAGLRNSGRRESRVKRGDRVGNGPVGVSPAGPVLRRHSVGGDERRGAMPLYLQADRPMTITTPLGKDDLLLAGFEGHEAISELFEFRLDLLAENETKIPFEKLLGQKITIHLALQDGRPRHFSGICSRFGQGTRDNTFTAYRMEVVPQFWFLTRRTQSRIFQQVT